MYFHGVVPGSLDLVNLCWNVKFVKHFKNPCAETKLCWKFAVLKLVLPVLGPGIEFTVTKAGFK